MDYLLEKMQTWWIGISTWWTENLTVVPREDYMPLLDTSGFLGILAFSVAAFTLSSPKFHLRQATAIFSFRPWFFGVLITSGIIMFTLEAITRYGLSFPKFINPNAVNFIVTVIIAILILYWMAICFIWPPRYTRFTADRFFQQTYSSINNGSQEELLALAIEIMREIPRIIKHCPTRNNAPFDDNEPPKITDLEACTNDLCLLLSDPRFCNVVAAELPFFPAKLVDQMIKLKRYDAPVQLIVRRIVIASLTKPTSALFVENEWLGQGFTGYVKPVTRAIFSNWHKIEPFEQGIQSPLDLDYPQARNWDTETWRVYFALAREYCQGLVSEKYHYSNARGIRHILDTTQQAFKQIGSLEGYENTFDPHNPFSHAHEANSFLADFIKIFDAAGETVCFNRTDKYSYGNDLSSKIAKLLKEVILYASEVNTKEFLMWDVQHNLVWSPIERLDVEDTKIMKMARRKLRRMIWDEIQRMHDFPNYVGARNIRFCLNVLGFYDEKPHRKSGVYRSSWMLTKVVSSWVKANYQTIAETHPRVAEAMLPANIQYNQKKQMLVRTKENTLTGASKMKNFPLDPPSAKTK